MDSNADLPITGMCVVSDPNKAPPNYTVIDRTYDRAEDADLWKDGLFGRRTMRYLCVERSIPDMSNSKDVLIDVTFINERDPPPPGFTVIENTHDTREKALKKKMLCGRWMLPSMTNDAITELIFLSRSSRKPPNGFSLIGETNSMSLCYKMGKISKPTSSPTQQQSFGPVQGYTPQAYNMNPVGSALPYQPPAAAPARGPGTLERSHSIVGGVYAPISGIPWHLNARFQTMAQLQNLTIPEIKYKTMMDIENEYAYDFHMERQAARGQQECSGYLSIPSASAPESASASESALVKPPSVGGPVYSSTLPMTDAGNRQASTASAPRNAPNSTAALPHRGATTPPAPGNAPNSTGPVPHRGATTPPAPGNAPASTGPVSHRGATTPQASGNAPASTGPVPHRGATTPPAPGNAPNSTGPLPSRGATTPPASGNAPNSTGPVPHRGAINPPAPGNALASTRPVPHRGATNPQAPGNAPASTGPVPHRGVTNPPSPGNAPASTGPVPHGGATTGTASGHSLASIRHVQATNSSSLLGGHAQPSAVPAQTSLGFIEPAQTSFGFIEPKFDSPL